MAKIINKKAKIIVTLLNITFAVGLVAIAWWVTKPKITTKIISQAELANANGQNGQKCYVALDGHVYEIKNSIYWENGQHKPSGGQAYCGRDLSNIISKSPHGKTILSRMTPVGPLR